MVKEETVTVEEMVMYYEYEVTLKDNVLHMMEQAKEVFAGKNKADLIFMDLNEEKDIAFFRVDGRGVNMIPIYINDIIEIHQLGAE